MAPKKRGRATGLVGEQTSPKLFEETMGLRNGDEASPAKAGEVKSGEINREAGKKLLIQLYKETGESVSVSISPSGS